MLSPRSPKQPIGLLPVEILYIRAALSLDTEIERNEAFYDIAAMQHRSIKWVRFHANQMRKADLEMRTRLLAEQAARAFGKTAKALPTGCEVRHLQALRPLSRLSMMAGRASSRSSHNVVSGE